MAVTGRRELRARVVMAPDGKTGFLQKVAKDTKGKTAKAGLNSAESLRDRRSQRSEGS